MTLIRQQLASRPLGDPDRALTGSMAEAGLGFFPAGGRIGIAVGSRNVDRIATLATSLVQELRSLGYEPFIIPAMGSHGGATEEGQLQVLARLGVTEESVCAPIEASLEVAALGRTPGGAEVFTARAALEADGIVVVNRVAPHTGFSGPVQSGVVKMIAVGLGKAEGARALHIHGFGAGELIGQIAAVALEALPPVVAVALVEDGEKKLSRLEVMPGSDALLREPELLGYAVSMWPCIPVARVDLLIVDEMGKDISGTGMDPLVTGRGKAFSEAESFNAERLVVLRLTEASGGNATGIGHADITTRALADAVDKVVTYKNVLTSGALYRARIPIVADTDREAVEMAVVSLGRVKPETLRIAHIKSTRSLAEFEVSAPLLEVLRGRAGIFVEATARTLTFDEDGAIVSPWPR
jgi:hypothetical protein